MLLRVALMAISSIGYLHNTVQTKAVKIAQLTIMNHRRNFQNVYIIRIGANVRTWQKVKMDVAKYLSYLDWFSNIILVVWGMQN